MVWDGLPWHSTYNLVRLGRPQLCMVWDSLARHDLGGSIAVHCLGRLLALFTSCFSPLFHTIEMLHVGVYSVSLLLTPEKDDIYFINFFLSIRKLMRDGTK